MKPLDLSKQPPRNPRVMLAGLLMMARTVDKARALLPGGNPGRYYITPGISGWMLKKLGLSEAEFIEVLQIATGLMDLRFEVFALDGSGALGNLGPYAVEKRRTGTKLYISFDRTGTRAPLNKEPRSSRKLYPQTEYSFLSAISNRLFLRI